MTAALGIAGPRPVLFVIGGADGLSKTAETSIRTLVDAGVVPAVETVGPVVVDGGTDAGIMAIVGGAIAAAHLQVPVLGVAPGGRVTWKDDTRAGTSGGTRLWSPTTAISSSRTAMRGAARRRSCSRWWRPSPTHRGRSPSSRAAAPGRSARSRRAVRRGIPVIALAGSGGVADDLAEAAAARAANRVPKLANPDLTAILGEIDLTVVAPDADPALLERLLLRRLQPDETLRTAWRQYRVLARTARQQQRAFGWYQRAILALGLLATILIVLQAPATEREGARSRARRPTRSSSTASC